MKKQMLMIAMLAVGLFVSAANAQVSEDMIRLVGKREVTQDDLQGYSAADLRILRNSIYAVHGRIFKSDDLKNYFSRFFWYKPKFANVDSKLTPVEKKNVATIKALEDAGGVPQGGGAQGGTFKDPRDGKIYRVVKIGNQTWMAQNLNYKTGDSYCYDGDDVNCIKFGRLYAWKAALKACPTGWRLPRDKEFEMLMKTVGGKQDEEAEGVWYDAGVKLKSTIGWNENGNGDDAFGFLVLPAGSRNDEGLSSGMGNDAFFWSSTKIGSSNAIDMYLGFDDNHAYLSNYSRKHAFSVRCVKD